MSKFKPIEKYSWLLSTGNFDVIYEGITRKIECIDIISAPSLLILLGQTQDQDSKWVSIEDCALVARPFGDISDIELYEFYKARGSLISVSSLKLLASSGNLPLKLVLVAANMGVYPGPQSDFDNINLISV